MKDVNFPQDFYLDDVGVWRLKKEKLAELENPKPMTNEEWRRTCSTEEFAEWLGDKLDYCQIMWYWACDKCTWSKKHESCMNDKEKWLEWLKRPHGGES